MQMSAPYRDSTRWECRMSFSFSLHFLFFFSSPFFPLGFCGSRRPLLRFFFKERKRKKEKRNAFLLSLLFDLLFFVLFCFYSLSSVFIFLSSRFVRPSFGPAFFFFKLFLLFVLPSLVTHPIDFTGFYWVLLGFAGFAIFSQFQLRFTGFLI